MSGHTNLYRRNATYYFRARVPKDIASHYGKAEEKFSLGTKEYHEAVKRVRLKAAEVERKFADCRRVIELQSVPLKDRVTDAFLEETRNEIYRRLLADDDTIKIMGVPLGDEEVLHFASHKETYKASIDSSLEYTRADYASANLEPYVNKALRWLGVSTNQKDVPEVRRLARVMQEAFLEAQEAIQKRNEGQLVRTPEKSKEAPSESELSLNGVLLSEVVDKWVADKSRVSWKKRTAQDHKHATSMFIELHGDRSFNSYSKSDAVAFKEFLVTFPANWTKNKQLRDLSLLEVTDKAHKLGIAPMSATNAKKMFQYLSELWGWMFAHYDEVERNIFDGITVEVHSVKRNERNPFTIEELNAIFSAPIFKGCQSESRWKNAGDFSMKDTAKFWVPLIGL